MDVPFLDLTRTHQSMQDELERIFKRVLNQSYFVYGRDVTRFEELFSLEHQVEHCVAVGNCTDALELTLKAFGIRKGDEVIVPALTWISDAEVVSNLGAKPVFVDVTDQGLIDLAQIETKITKATKAIIPVHLYGQMADMVNIMELASEHRLKVIEDCAQAVYAKQHGQRAGTYGHAAVFSFYPTKNLGALGDAGCVLTNDEALAKTVRKLANHGAPDKHSHEFPGSNSRMDTLQAAILNSKLPWLSKWNEERKQIAAYYNEELNHLPIKLPAIVPGNTHVFHLYQIQTDRRGGLKTHLKEQGIQTQIHYPAALPFTKAYEFLNHEFNEFPNAYRIQQQTLSLPMFPGIKGPELMHVVDVLCGYFK